MRIEITMRIKFLAWNKCFLSMVSEFITKFREGIDGKGKEGSESRGDFIIADKKKAKSEDLAFKVGSSYWTWTSDLRINSPSLYQLS